MQCGATAGSSARNAGAGGSALDVATVPKTSRQNISICFCMLPPKLMTARYVDLSSVQMQNRRTDCPADERALASDERRAAERATLQVRLQLLTSRDSHKRDAFGRPIALGPGHLQTASSTTRKLSKPSGVHSSGLTFASLTRCSPTVICSSRRLKWSDCSHNE